MIANRCLAGWCTLTPPQSAARILQPTWDACLPAATLATQSNRRFPAARAHNSTNTEPQNVEVIPFLRGCICLPFMIRTSLFVNLRFLPV